MMLILFTLRFMCLRLNVNPCLSNVQYHVRTLLTIRFAEKTTGHRHLREACLSLSSISHDPIIACMDVVAPHTSRLVEKWTGTRVLSRQVPSRLKIVCPQFLRLWCIASDVTWGFFPTKEEIDHRPACLIHLYSLLQTCVWKDMAVKTVWESGQYRGIQSSCFGRDGSGGK